MRRTVSSSYQQSQVHWQNASIRLQDFLAIVMDIMTMHINPQYKHIIMFYCCLQKSIAKSLSREYSASNGLAAKGLHFSHPHRELSIEQDLTLLSIGVAAYA